MTSFRASCVQLCASRSVDDNLEQAVDLIRAAAADGANYVLTPEQTTLMELNRESLFGRITAEADDRCLPVFATLAQQLGIWLHIGSIAVQVGPEQAANRSYLFDPNGDMIAKYDKIHMFDVSLAGGESYRESRTYRAGETAVIAPLPWAKLGMSICYDLRFPDLYWQMAQAGAELFTVPAAFTQTTGEVHWHPLLRARAIETGAFVLAAAQSGTHENGRQTFGHSLIIDPWGKILAELDNEVGVVSADIDVNAVSQARQRIPNLAGARSFTLIQAGDDKSEISQVQAS